MDVLRADRAFVTWTDESTDREDPGYFLPSTVALEERLLSAGAVRLRDIANVVMRPWKPTGTGLFQYVDISAVDNKTGQVTPATMAVEDAPSRARQLIRPGDILVSSVRPERGAVARAGADHDGAVASSGFFVVELKADWIHVRDALYVFLLSDVYRKQAVRRASSSMYPVIGVEEFKEILVPAAVLEECTVITYELTSSEAAFRRAAEHLESARASLRSSLSPFL